MKTTPSHLVPFSLAYLPELRAWFSEQADIEKWAGPNFRVPHTEQSFGEDIRYQSLASYCLVNKDNNLLAFGQYYKRLNHCHLGRLVVNPALRGKNLAASLIKALALQGMRELNLSSLSLFVLADNIAAISAYQKLGFVEHDYPEQLPLENCLYMVLLKPAWLLIANFDFLE